MVNSLDSEIKNVSETASLLKLYTTNMAISGMSKAVFITTRAHPRPNFAVAVRSCQTALSTAQPSPLPLVLPSVKITVWWWLTTRMPNFLEFVFGNNCTVHGNVNIVFNYAIPPTSGL